MFIIITMLLGITMFNLCAAAVLELSPLTGIAGIATLLTLLVILL